VKCPLSRVGRRGLDFVLSKDVFGDDNGGIEELRVRREWQSPVREATERHGAPRVPLGPAEPPRAHAVRNTRLRVRVRRALATGTHHGERNSVQTKQETFIWCGSRICQTRSGATVVRSYFGQGFEQGTDDYFYTRDHLGSVREVLGSDGTTVGSRADLTIVTGEDRIIHNGKGPAM
jgi:hypothetical protein